MAQLIIQPVCYEGKRLPELGDRILAVFNPLFDDYVIRSQLTLAHIPPDFLKKQFGIEGEYFPVFLSWHGKPILGITKLEAFRKDGKWVYGYGSQPHKAAFVSTFKREFKLIDTDEHLERVVIESLHELGHVFGLGHHDESIQITKNNKYCPMTTAHASQARAKKITWAEFISARDSTAFCDECYERLRFK